MPQEVIEITEREIEIIEVIERGPVGPTGPQPNINYEVVSSARTLEAADLIAADTSGGSFTLTLPANPSNGDAVDIFDFSETFDTNPLTIARNGQPIESLNEDLVANVEGAYFTLIYTGSTRGWQVLPRYGTSGGGGESALTTQGDMLYRGVGINTRLPIGSAGQILKVNSGATAPEWGAAPATGVTSVGVSGSDGIEVDSGSPITGSGTIALGVNAASLRSHINVADGANNYTHPNHSGEVTSSGDGATTIANDVVTNAKLANVATATIKGRATAGAGDPEDLTASQVRTILNVADGAEVNVQSNWTEADSGSDAFILNKPSIPTASSTTPSALGVAAAGSSNDFARADHVHAMPSAADVGAAAASHTHDASAITSGTLNNDRVNFAAPPAIGNTTPNSGAFTTLSASTSLTLGTSGILSGGTNTIEQRNTTSAQTFRIYNTVSGAADANFERGFMRWSSNVLQIGTEKGGTGSARALEFQTDGTSRLTISTAGVFQFGGTTSSFPALKRSSTTLQVRLADDSADAPLSCSGITVGVGSETAPSFKFSNSSLGIYSRGVGEMTFSDGSEPQWRYVSNALYFNSDFLLGWGSSTAAPVSVDTLLRRDAAGTIAQYNGLNAQAYRLYNTFTSSTNFERLNVRWASNECIIDAEAGSGGGTLRGIKIGSATSSLLGFYGVTPVDQPATVADPAGGGTIDTEARTAIGEIIDRLQELGLIA